MNFSHTVYPDNSVLFDNDKWLHDEERENFFTTFSIPKERAGDLSGEDIYFFRKGNDTIFIEVFYNHYSQLSKKERVKKYNSEYNQIKSPKGIKKTRNRWQSIYDAHDKNKALK